MSKGPNQESMIGRYHWVEAMTRRTGTTKELPIKMRVLLYSYKDNPMKRKWLVFVFLSFSSVLAGQQRWSVHNTTLAAVPYSLAEMTDSSSLIVVATVETVFAPHEMGGASS